MLTKHIEKLDTMPIGIAEHEMIFNNQGVAIDYKFLYVNDKFCEIVSLNKNHLINKMATTIYPCESKNRIKYFEKLFKGREILDFDTIFVENESYYNIKAYKTSENTFTTLLYDISNLKMANDELNHLLDYHKSFDILNYKGLEKRLKIEGNITHAIAFVITIKHANSIYSYYGYDFTKKLYLEITNMLKQYVDNGNITAHTSYSQIYLILLNPTKEEISSVLNATKDNLYRQYEINGKHISVNKNVGYAILKETNDLEELLRRASIANIFASNSEHSEIVEYTNDLNELVNYNTMIAVNLNNAINDDEIDIYFQRIIDSKTGETKYFEALSRWTSKTLGFVPPDILFDMALKNGINDILDEYIIEKTLRIYSIYLKENELSSNIILSINLSQTSLYKHNIENFIRNKVLLYNLDPKKIVLEISENTFFRDVDYCIKVINKLKNFGFIIAIDDFGTKYSSLGVLETIPFDILKFDGMFTKKINEISIYNLVKTITNNMLYLNKKIIVEKVETKQEAMLFNNLGCLTHQGYLYHKPEKFVQNQKK